MPEHYPPVRSPRNTRGSRSLARGSGTAFAGEWRRRVICHRPSVEVVGVTRKRWADVVAHLIPLTVLPSGLWRVALAFGLGVGAVGTAPPVGGERVYIVCLSLVSEGAALLSFGLVRPWGEVLPRWLPLVG